MSQLKAVESLSLPDCWIGAGFLRNTVWDALHSHPITGALLGDVDVVYFEAVNANRGRDQKIEDLLRTICPNVPWSVKNQARMHLKNGDPPYTGTIDAMRNCPETATAIAARSNGAPVELAAPYGVDDLLNMIVRPTPPFLKKMKQYDERLESKNWVARWPMVQVSLS